MPMVSKKSTLQPDKALSKEKRQQMAIVVAEMRNRGLEVPRDILGGVHLEWPIDENGYFIKNDGKKYQPNPNQSAFVKTTALFSAIFGGRGSGKTAGGAQKALKKIKEGQNGAILNPDFENFKISTWPEFREWIPWDLVVPTQKHRRNPEWQPEKPFIMAFINGVRVICKGLHDPDGARGPNVNWLWYDEAGRDPTGEAWKIAVASVRIGDDPQAWVTTTPKKGKMGWLNKFFVLKDIPQDALDEFAKLSSDRPFIEYFFGSIFENSDNLDPTFFAMMLAAYPGGWQRQQELYGKIVDEGGTIGDRSWFNGKLLAHPMEDVYSRVRYWDLAATEEKVVPKKGRTPDETVGNLMSYSKEPSNKFCIEHQECGRWDWDDILKSIITISARDGFAVKVIIEEEPGASGKNLVAVIDKAIKAAIPGHPGCVGWRPSGDRVALANIWFAEAKSGQFYIFNSGWDVEGFLSQLDAFPDEEHDDRITSVTGARINIAPITLWKDIPFLAVGMQKQETQETQA